MALLLAPAHACTQLLQDGSTSDVTASGSSSSRVVSSFSRPSCVSGAVWDLPKYRIHGASWLHTLSHVEQQMKSSK